MPLPYTGKHGELNFEADIVELMQQSGWEHTVLKNPTIDDLISNWRDIILDRNRAKLSDVALSDNEMLQLLDIIKQQANTPVKANMFLNTADRGVAIVRDKDSQDKAHAGKEVYLNLFDTREIAGGTSRYQIAEQVIFQTGDQYPDRRGDITLLIDGIPVIQIELKASGVDVFEACTQIQKYTMEGVFTGLMSFVQVFWAITPEDALYFSNPGSVERFNPSFYFHWGDRDNNTITNWRELITGQNHILSVPEAHKMIGYYTVADKNLNTLMVSRSYQYTAIKAIVKRTAKQKWGDHDQKGGYCWVTTGGGKTMTSFKAGQLIIDMNLADKVVFVVDRRALDEQSTQAYNSFEREGESVSSTTSTVDLFNKLKSDDAKDSMIMTSIQKLSNITEDAKKFDSQTLQTAISKRIVFIIDEAHRSQFGDMHAAVKNTFYNSLFFGFTGTPIMKANMKDGEQTTESVFGPCLAVYSLATGIRDHNVLGFWPEYISMFNENELRQAVGLKQVHAKDVSDIKPGTDAYKAFQYYIKEAPMAAKYDSEGNVAEKGIEDFLTDADFNNDEYREGVVESILKNLFVISHGVNGTLFHGMLTTTSIPEAYAYWLIFHKKAPELHVTALFDPNVNVNTANVINKEQWLTEIVDQYNRDFGTSYTRKTDPIFSTFKADIIARLSHKKPYANIGNDKSKCIDIIIVVDQLLTGFDSARLNIIYMDKVMEMDGLIQAISRTNRIYNSDEKPWGMVKFFRKPETMRHNLDAALELYCQGDSFGVKEKELKENITAMNDLFDDITNIFAHDAIVNFVKNPSSDEDRQKFRKDFTVMKAAMRAAILQGFDWNNKYAHDLKFDEVTYRTLTARFNELPSSGKHKNPPKGDVGLGLDINMSSAMGAQIDAAYLESRFRILTISDVEKAEARQSREEIIKDIEDHIGVLPENLQKYALQVLDDIRNGILTPEPGKALMTYIMEYREKSVRKAVGAEAERLHVYADALYKLYEETTNDEIDQIKLQKIEDSADIDSVMSLYGCSRFRAKKELHAELTSFIMERKAEYHE